MASIYLVACLSLAFLSNICQADLIGDVCSKSRNPGLCNNALRNTPGAATADLRSLGKILVTKALEATTATQNVVQSLPRSPSKDFCLANCKDAYVFINVCTNYLNLTEPRLIIALKTSVARARNDLSSCDAKYGGRPGEPKNLAAATGRALDFLSMISAVADKL